MGLSLFLTDIRSRDDGLIVSLAAAGGKDYLTRLGVNDFRDFLAGFLKAFLCLLSDGVEARRVAEGVVQVIGHRVDGRLVHSGGRCVVRIDLRQISAPLQGIVSYGLSIAYIPHKVNRFIGCTNSEKIKAFFCLIWLFFR